MNKFSICILHHPDRKHLLKSIYDSLGGLSVSLSVDDGIGNVENSLQAWSAYDSRDDFHIVIDDDSILCKDFIPRLGRFLTNKDSCYCLYWGERKLDEFYIKNGYYLTEWFYYGNAMCLPVKLIDNMLEYTKQIRFNKFPFDMRVAHFVQENHIPVYYPIPCLVNHRDDVKSLSGTDKPGRKSLYFIDEVK